MGRKAKKLFQDDLIGRMMGVVAIDTTYGKVDLMAPILDILDGWTNAFYALYSEKFKSDEARRRARQFGPVSKVQS